MTLPEKIRIARYAPDPGVYTDLIGRCADGTQFMAFTLMLRAEKGSEERRKVCAILHTFDADGTHLQTQVWSEVLNVADIGSGDRPEKKRDEMLSKLPPRTLCDVVVKPFSVRVDGQVYGLVDETYTEDGETYVRLVLEPNDLLFTPPWDGSFDT